MLEWTQTKTINRYTGKPSVWAQYSIAHCIVYRRKYGYAYTIRVPMHGNRWFEVAPGNNEYFRTEELAKLAVLASLPDVQDMISPEFEDWPAL